ncbi:soluble quino protein glucose dehydrogenase [Polychaeton citri CBS 116435]|uniref:Soluble quino protein glucose dehydrogenase n=1 Tax=Polychaeton citri CBS 116435 TaxID=1314669 RepID=A0A9P4PZA7_9PEZI|nr:soluble quino protein glucose dehydrogenase [Polychaeton citri CBS 116435]
MKFKPISYTAVLLAHLLAVPANAQSSSCSPSLTASYPAPSVADGFTARLVANNLTSPRGIHFDNAGNLLVVEQEVGITALIFSSDDCTSLSNRSTLISNDQLNHGITVSSDGSILYASSSDAVYAWQYDAGSTSVAGEPTTLVANMTNSDHTTRTLLLSRQAPGLLVVTRGSTSNIDALASDIGTGHSQVKAFNISNITSSDDPYDFNRDGLLLAWGVRNDVGVDEHPVTGGIYTVENSVDEMMRQGVDVHETNPAEELNFMGFLNGTSSPNQGGNFGYPECYAAWNTSVIPDFNGTVGTQFVIGDLNSTNDDAACESRIAPRLSFEAHMAPLDILFNSAGTAAWVTFHGSWDRDEPAGYKLSVVPFDADTGEPTAPADSRDGYADVVANVDNSNCPDECFRPVGLAWDSTGRLWMSSDSTGEIYVIERADNTSVEGSGSNSTNTIPGFDEGNGTTTGGDASSPTETGAAPTSAEGVAWSALAVVFGVLAFLM